MQPDSVGCNHRIWLFCGPVFREFRGNHSKATGCGLLSRPAALVVFRVLVNGPDVVQFFPRYDIPRRQHGCHHSVILIVIFMHSVAANEMQTWELTLDLDDKLFHVGLVMIVIHWISLFLADHTSVLNVHGIE